MRVPTRRLRVLIADDHALIRRSFRQDLEAARIDVCAEATTGAEAVRAALAERPSLCLLDVRMPEGGRGG
jgi:DNA-binding NarL/FixJ family response regulator